VVAGTFDRLGPPIETRFYGHIVVARNSWPSFAM